MLSKNDLSALSDFLINKLEFIEDGSLEWDSDAIIRCPICNAAAGFCSLSDKEQEYDLLADELRALVISKIKHENNCNLEQMIGITSKINFDAAEKIF